MLQFSVLFLEGEFDRLTGRATAARIWRANICSPSTTTRSLGARLLNGALCGLFSSESPPRREREEGRAAVPPPPSSSLCARSAVSLRNHKEGTAISPELAGNRNLIYESLATMRLWPQVSEEGN